jgi:nucleoside-diphosphate-sugar epimerase
MQNIVITGAAGFIGSTLANYFYKKNQDTNLILIDTLEYGNLNNLDTAIQSKLIKSNCLNIEELESIIPNESVVFHFAGISSLSECESDYNKSIDNNFLSTVNIIEISAKKKAIKFFFASTSAIYENNKSKPFTETDETSPDLMYSYSKKMCEDYLNFRSLKKDCPPIIITRFFNVFGYNQNVFRKNPPLTAYLIECAKNNVTAKIYNNDTSTKRDYIFIDDLIYILVTFFDKYLIKKFDVINLTSGNLYSVEDIINILKEVSGKNIKVEFEKPQLIWSKYPIILEKISQERIVSEVYKTSHGSNLKLKQLIGNEFNFISMKEGLSMMLNIKND